VERLLLIRHATTALTRRAAFPTSFGDRPVEACEPLDAAGLRQSARLRACLPATGECVASHALRCIETAQALGFEHVVRRSELAECDFGAWAGRTLEQVHEQDPVGLRSWLEDPDATPHGGESLTRVRERARGFLEARERAAGTCVAIAHGGFIKAALLEVLQLPSFALWQLDVAPCSVTELHPGPASWRIVRLNWTPTLEGPGSTRTRSATAPS